MGFVCLEANPQTNTNSQPVQNSNPFKLTRLTLPIHLSHLKSGNTLSTNGKVLVLQDGSSTIEVRKPPDFKPTKIPWRNGVLRDIVWSAGLNAFILLTKNALYSLKLNAHEAYLPPSLNPAAEFTVRAYSQIKPSDEQGSFWRCACVQSTLYIAYAGRTTGSEGVSSFLYIASLGFGTVIDEYAVTGSSCKLVNRWIPPKTCANHEGIWCIRYHPETDQLGCAIVDASNNQWRLEIRSRESFACLWKINMPFLSGDCEIFPFPNGEWLATNSFNIRLLQIGYQVLRSAVEYERELKNAIVINDLYLVIRTKSTVEVHRLDGPKWCHLCLMWIEKEFGNRFIRKERRKTNPHTDR